MYFSYSINLVDESYILELKNIEKDQFIVNKIDKGNSLQRKYYTTKFI